MASASKNVVDEVSETKPSTSKDSALAEPVDSITKLVEQIKIWERELTVQKFERLFNDEYKKMKATPTVYVDESPELTKSNALSVDFRKAGRSLAKEGMNVESLVWYTRSISFAENGSEELAQAYVKRSKSLYRLHLYDQCVEDIERALTAGKYSADARKKLQRRKVRCFVKRRKATTKAQLKLNSSGSPPFEVVKEEPSTASANAEVIESEWNDMRKFENTHIPNASSKIRIGYDEEKQESRIEAAENLEPGELVACQKLFTVSVREMFRPACCSYCITLYCAALIPCLTCSQMMYCSEKCRDLAYQSYHRLECKITRLVIGPNDLKHQESMILRAMLIGTEQGVKLASLMQRMTVQDLMKTNFSAGETFEDDYASFLRLSRTYCSERMKEFVPFIVRLIDVLEYVGFFEGDSSNQDTMNEAQMFTAFLLLNHRVGMNLYYFTLMPEKYVPPNLETKFLGTAHFSLFSIMNHSCDSNVFLISRNRDEVALFTSQPIAKGEELTITYGFSYTTDQLLHRRNELFNLYKFKCQCVPCRDNWPTEKILADIALIFQDNIIKHKKAKSELKTLISPIADPDKFMSLTVKEILRIVLDVCKWLYTNIRQPSFYHGQIQALVFIFVRLRYDRFSQHISTEELIKHAFDICLLLIDSLGMDANKLPAPATIKRKKKKNKKPAETVPWRTR